MTLRSKINWLTTLNILFVLVLVISALFYIFVENKFNETGLRALGLAKTIAVIPEVVEAFQDPDPASIIQPLVEKIRHETGADALVVGNMDLIRYSHPTIEQIGKHMVGDDNDIVLSGRESITRAEGTLGPSVRGKAPIFDRDHNQIGVVSAVFLVKNLWDQLSLLLLQISGIGSAALLFGLLGAYLLSGHIKRQILNMEPHEIAFVTQQQAAILEAIREGIIAVNDEGKIVTCNREAKKMLMMEDADLIGKELSTILPTTRLLKVHEDGIPQNDQPMIVGNTLVIANRLPVILSGQVIGTVSTFRDKIELDQIDRRLADIGQYADTLRSQRHEFMNKLHLISGLIEISEYDMARNVIKQVNQEQQEVLQYYLTRIRDSAIVGILVGKRHRAGELGIQLNVSSESQITGYCPHREIVVSILGNTIENAFDACQSVSPEKGPFTVTVFIKEVAGNLLIHVRDNGPGVDQAIREHLFEYGTTTKGQGRGFGLAFISRIVSNVGGDVICDSSSAGTLIRVSLPIRRNP